ncbi:MAG: tetraacyldisaccharide 4'-kinase, partial [Planctomycetales bacterium]
MIPAILRASRWLLEFPYTAAVCWRNRQYDSGRRTIHQAGVPVVSVGNLTMGGTGKTPFVQWLARWFRKQNVRVAVVSRGYGAEAGSANDEALQLERNLPDVPHLENPDRVDAARVAVEELDTQLILLDDGFQHRRLARDLDVVLLDATEPFGWRHVCPRGMLREPISGLRRADVIALSRADCASDSDKQALREEVRRIHPAATWVELAHVPTRLINASQDEQSLDFLNGRKVAAFCGIGNPAAFARTLDDLGCRATEFREFDDHHAYQTSDIEDLTRWAEQQQVEAVLCTEKDLVKLELDHLGDVPLWAVAVETGVLAGEADLEALL